MDTKRIIKLTFFIFALLFSKLSLAQEHQHKTMMWDGIERQYLMYVPANVTSSAPVLFCLHGLGNDMTEFATLFNFDAIADQHGWIVITPQALLAELPVIGSMTAWNSGIAGEFMGTEIAVNSDVDDKGFLMAILDTLIANYDIDQNQVFFAGFSMGGFMTNRMAIECGNRITAIVSASGTIATPLATQIPVAKIKTMHIHGDADQTVSYPDASFPIFGSVGLGAEATVEYWRSHNQCNTTPEIYDYPDIVADGLTFRKYTYSGGENNTVTAFIKVFGGEHTYYYKPEHDIDYRIEMFNFFTNQSVSIAENNKPELSIFPNQVNDRLFIKGENIVQITIYDMHGRMLLSETKTTNQISVSDLSQGVYVIKIQTADQLKTMKFVKL